MIDLSFPWAIGPVPLGLTVAGVYGLFSAFVARKGVSFAAVMSILALVSGVAAFTVHLWRPSVDHMTIVLTAQAVCTAVLLLLCWLLWIVRKPEGETQRLERNTAQTRASFREVVKGLLVSLACPLVMNLLIFFFPSTPNYCRRLDYRGGYSASATKCHLRENLFGLHDLPLEIYFGVLVGVFGLGLFILIVFRLCLKSKAFVIT
jgi:hypothetical protein